MMGPLTYGAIGIGGLALYSVMTDKYSPFSYGQSNVGAFLAMIREYESANNYNAYVYGDTFQDMRVHPINTREKSFVPRIDDGRPTSAAGAYQITWTTWDGLKRLYGFSNFYPVTQDAAAIQLIRDRLAYSDVYNGNFASAVAKLGNEWEALSVRPYHQLLGTYQLNGGLVS